MEERKEGCLVFHSVTVSVCEEERTSRQEGPLTFFPVHVKRVVEEEGKKERKPNEEEEERMTIGQGENVRPLVDPFDQSMKVPAPIRQRTLDKIFDKMISVGIPRSIALDDSVSRESSLFSRCSSKDIYRCELPGILREIGRKIEETK